MFVDFVYRGTVFHKKLFFKEQDRVAGTGKFIQDMPDLTLVFPCEDYDVQPYRFEGQYAFVASYGRHRRFFLS